MNDLELAIAFYERQGYDFGADNLDIIRMLSEFAAEERERCALLADSYTNNPPSNIGNNTEMAFKMGMNHETGCIDCAGIIASEIRKL